MNKSLIPLEHVESIIYVIRGQRVMLDADLAMIYGVDTKVLNQAVERNIDCFPDDFAFRLIKEEWNHLKSQFVTSNNHSDSSLKFQFGTSKIGRGGKHKLPRVFTEHGAYAAAFVLRSDRARKMSVEVVRAFIHMRKILASHEQFSKELGMLKSFMLKHSHENDRDFRKVWKAIEKLSSPPPQEQRRIGFDLSC